MSEVTVPMSEVTAPAATAPVPTETRAASAPPTVPEFRGSFITDIQGISSAGEPGLG